MKNFLKLDWTVLFSVLLLIAVGLLSLYSISLAGGSQDSGHFFRQLIAVAIGFVAMLSFSFFDYRALGFYSTKLYFAGICILGAVFIWGMKIRGTTGWIGLGNFHIQPVEIVKVVMIIFLASFLSKKKMELSSFSRVIVSAILVAIPVFLIMQQPDFGSAAIILGIWAAMLVASDISKKNIFILFSIGILAAAGGWFVMKDYQKERLINFANPLNDPKGGGYNVIQSIVAVGSGGMYGKGLGHGSQSQLNFLPEKHTDFIFAVIAEELGFFGAAIVLGVFGIIIFRMGKTAQLARDNFGYLLIVGIMAMISLQVVINIGMNIGVSPVAGVPLPLLSYGGSAMVSVLASLGIVQSVYFRRIKII